MTEVADDSCSVGAAPYRPHTIATLTIVATNPIQFVVVRELFDVALVLSSIHVSRLHAESNEGGT